MDLTTARELERAGRLDDAEGVYRRLLQSSPADARLHQLLGMFLYRRGKADEAVQLLRRSVELAPNVVEFRNNLAGMLGSLGRHADAEQHLRAVLRLQPQYPEALNNLGVALELQGRWPEAERSYRAALAQRPAYPEAHNNLANALRKLGRLDDAIEHHRAALALRAQYPEALNNLASTLGECADQGGMVRELRRASALRPASAGDHSNLLYAMLHDPGTSSQVVLDESRRWSVRHEMPLAGARRPHANDRSPDRRLRIGYVSPDFAEHPVARIIAPVLASHDRAAFEVFCYSAVRAPDDMTERLGGLADVWRPIAHLPDAHAAELVRADGIDILVDLSGHLASNRLLLFARSPAPIQVQLSYPATTGLRAMDYRITDADSDPPGIAESRYTERLVRLPTAWIYQPDEDSPEVGPLPAQGNGHVTFGCFNRVVKVTPPAIALWSKLLHAVPGSRLMLLAGSAGAANNHVAGAFARQGIGADRLALLSPTPRRQYLERFNQIDIVLDPFPYNGEATTFDGFWMGVPLVTLIGDSCVSRRGLSHLRAISLSDLAAVDAEHFVRIGAALASDLPRLAQLRLTLRDRYRRSWLGRPQDYTRQLEAACRAMWRRWCEQSTSAGRPVENS